MNAVSEAFHAQASDVQVVIRTATHTDQSKWDAFVYAHPKSTVFHLWAWGDIVERVHGLKNKSLIALAGGEVVGILPISHQKSRLFSHSLGSMPFCPYAGPLAIDGPQEQALIQAAIECAQNLGADQLELRLLHETDSDTSALALQDLYVTFRKEIFADHEANMNAIPRKQRAMVRKGIKNELTSELGTATDFFDLYSDNIHRHGTPGSPLAFFKAICQSFGKDAEVLIVKSKEGVILTGVLSLYFKNEVLPFYAGDVTLARDLAANDFKYWEVMRRAADRGCTVFDFGRSKKGTGPWSFKKNWGFEPTQLHYKYKLLKSDSIPEHNPLNPKYQLMISTWRKLPRGFVNWLGPKVVPGLG
jgi:FemAB-related protein (PEP-CTERM system-associated)